MEIKGLLYDIENVYDANNIIISYGNDLFLQYFYLDYSINPIISDSIPQKKENKGENNDIIFAKFDNVSSKEHIITVSQLGQVVHWNY